MTDKNKKESAGFYYRGRANKKRKADSMIFIGNFSVGKAEIGKWLSVLLVVLYICILLWHTAGSTKSFENVAQSVESSLDTENLVKQDGQALKRYYGLNSADYNGVLYYSSEFTISAEEVLVIEAKSETQVEHIRDAIEDRLRDRRETFADYAPKQAQMIEQAEILVRGKYVFVAVSPVAEEYKKIFMRSL